MYDMRNKAPLTFLDIPNNKFLSNQKLFGCDWIGNAHQCKKRAQLTQGNM